MEQSLPAAPATAPEPSAIVTLPLTHVPGYPAFLSEVSNTPGVLLANPLRDLGTLRSQARFTPEHRAVLVESLQRDLNAWDAPQAARECAAMLAEPDTYAVVTGQQAGIAGGPLYTFFKAVGTLRTAGELARLYPEHRFVPVFWIEADDHDFDEVRALTVLDRGGAPATVSYDDGDARALHVGDREVNAAGLESLIGGLRELLPATEFGEEALRLLTGAYAEGGARTLADGFARFMYAVLGDTPLVLMSSRNPAVKRLAADVLAREAADPSALFAAITEATGRMEAAALPTPIQPKKGSLFLDHEGERRSLEVEEGGYVVKGTAHRLTFEEAGQLARTAPERFSPKVSLRPVVQDAVLPTALYLGGPSEVAYLWQLRDGYDVFGVEAPAVAPRPFAIVMDPKVRRVLDAAGIGIDALLAPDFDAAAIMVDAAVQTALDGAHRRALDKLAEAGIELEEITAAIDPTLTKALAAAVAGATKNVDDHVKRLNAALRRKQQTEIDRLNAARTSVMPGRELQERTLNVLSLLARFGTARVRTMLSSIEMREGVVQVVEI